LNRGKVPLKFLFRAALTDTVGLGDAIAIEIFWRFFLMLPMTTRRLCSCLPVAVR